MKPVFESASLRTKFLHLWLVPFTLVNRFATEGRHMLSAAEAKSSPAAAASASMSSSLFQLREVTPYRLDAARLWRTPNET